MEAGRCIVRRWKAAGAGSAESAATETGAVAHRDAVLYGLRKTAVLLVRLCRRVAGRGQLSCGRDYKVHIGGKRLEEMMMSSVER